MLGLLGACSHRKNFKFGALRLIASEAMRSSQSATKIVNLILPCECS